MFLFLRQIADNKKPESFANRLRRKRFALFSDFLSTLPKPLKIIDVGGTQLFWEQMNFLPGKDLEITLLNVTKPSVNKPGFTGLEGDATNMNQIPDNFYDVAFSNSVIEHVGGLEEQQKMAGEMQRIAKNIFLQTPNRYFPIEPHFLFPFFQFLPLSIKAWLILNLKLGWRPNINSKEKAKKVAQSIRLMSLKELRFIFHGALIHKEKMFGITKSYIVVLISS